MSDIDDLMREAHDLTYSYKAMADGHHSRLRMWLQETYGLHLRFRDNAEAFRELLRHQFWERSRQKPKPTTSRWLLLFVTRTTLENERSRVGKYAAVLDFFTEVKLPENCVAEAIERMSGVDAAHKAALRTRRMRLVPAPDMSIEQHEGEAGTDLAVATSNSPTEAGVTFAEVASLELGGVDRTNEFAVVSRLTEMLADPSALGFEVESIPKKRGSPFSLDNTIVVEEVPDLDFNEIIGGTTPTSPVRRYIIVVDVLPRDPLTNLVPVKLIASKRDPALVKRPRAMEPKLPHSASPELDELDVLPPGFDDVDPDEAVRTRPAAARPMPKESVKKLRLRGVYSPPPPPPQKKVRLRGMYSPPPPPPQKKVRLRGMYSPPPPPPQKKVRLRGMYSPRPPPPEKKVTFPVRRSPPPPTTPSGHSR